MNLPNEHIEALTTLTTKLKVSNDISDVDIIEVTGDVLNKEIEVLGLDTFSETSMVTRVFVRKGCSTSFLKKIFSRMWKFRNPWQVGYLDSDSTSFYFGFSFASHTDMDWVMSRMPWCFTGGFLLGAQWPAATGDWKETNLNYLPLTIIISHIPLKLFTENNLKSWIHLVDPNADFRWKGTNLDMMKASTRTRVNLPIDKRPTAGFFVPFEGRNHWIQIKFDRLPIICYKCGSWGHDKQECTGKLVAIRDENGELIQLYGPWLHSDYVGTCFTPIIGNKEWKVENTAPLAQNKTESSPDSKPTTTTKVSYCPPESQPEKTQMGSLAGQQKK